VTAQCPICGSRLKRGRNGKWLCLNPECAVIFVKFDPFGRPKRIVMASEGHPR